MGIADSNLSSTDVNDNGVNGVYTRFDYVVAVSQDSINAALDSYLYNGLNEVILCYVYDNNNNPQQIDYNTFVTSANNTDPFKVPDLTPASDPRVQNLVNANFAFAIKAKLGMPPGVSSYPDIVALKPGQSSVTYTMLFSEFVATELIYGPRDKVTWFNRSQLLDTIWSFTGSVDLNLLDADFTNLPPEVQQQIKDIGDPNMFSVQQLYYDLNNAGLEQSFNFAGAPSNSALGVFMTGDFINAYWASLKVTGKSVLGYGAKQQTPVDPATLAVTNLNFFTPDPVADTKDPNPPLMLNYLCAVNGNTLPDTTHAGFGWNWLDSAEASEYDGVAALNRNTFARYLDAHLQPYVWGNCYAPSVRLTYDVGKAETEVSVNIGHQAPTVSFPSTGAIILSYSNSASSSDSAGLDGDMGKMTVSSDFNLNVSVAGNQMIIDQHLKIYLSLYANLTTVSGDIVDIQITDTYEFGIDNQGKIVLSTPDANATPPTSVRNDQSRNLDVSGFANFFADVNGTIDSITAYGRSLASGTLRDIPVSYIQDFVFPGGTTFSFTNVLFSDNQDLVAYIKYADVASYYAKRQRLAQALQSNS